MRYWISRNTVISDTIAVFVVEVGVNDLLQVMVGNYQGTISGILVDALLIGRILLFLAATAILAAPAAGFALLNQHYHLDGDRGWLKYCVGIALGFVLCALIPNL